MTMHNSCLILLSLTLLLSCQTVQQVENEFISTQKAWQSIAMSSAQLYKKHQLIILAKPIWSETELERVFSITDISFSKAEKNENESPYHLNLLDPKFTYKFACGWYCELLNEVKYTKINGDSVYLSKLYSQNQEALIKFYDDLILIEELINNLNITPDTLQVRFLKLKQTSISFGSLTQATEFMKDTLTTNAPYFTPENQGGSPEIIGPLQSKVETVDSNIVESPGVNNHLNDYPKQFSDKEVFYIDQFVCSFKDNYFGNIIDIKDSKLAVNLTGQAKATSNSKDNIINRKPGYLFKQSGDFTYIQLSEIKVFQKTDISACDIKF